MSVSEKIDQIKRLGARAAAAQLIMPALDLRSGENPAFGAAINSLSELPFCGYLFFGGDCQQVKRITRSLRRIAHSKEFPRPVFTADVERGLGQIVAGGNLFPPFEALAATADGPHWARQMGAAIARECLSVGIDWLFSPVADLADVTQNPIVGSRSFGKDPNKVAELVAAFVAGVEQTGALSCVKHFPGHGGTVEDSHASLPSVLHDRQRLIERDLVPFQRAFDQGASSIMTAHVAYPKLGSSTLPATLDASLIRGHLREQMGYDGLVVTDAFIMSGLRDACKGDEGQAAVMALDAGCDLILYPSVIEPVLDAVARNIDQKGWPWIEPSLRRILSRKAQLPDILESDEIIVEVKKEVKDLAHQIARASQKPVPKELSRAFAKSDQLRLIIIDDDKGSEAGADFIAAIRHRFRELYLSWLDPSSSAADREAVLDQLRAQNSAQLFLIRCSIKAWKERPGLHRELVRFLELALENAKKQNLTHAIVALAGQKVMETIPVGKDQVLMAYGEGPACEEEALWTLLDSCEP